MLPTSPGAPAWDADSLKFGLSSISQGGMAVVAHDPASEAGGVIVMAADAAIADSFSFMARHSSGAVRVALSHERAKALRLPEAATQDSGYAGAFPGAPVDYRDTQGHGKTASDQALTARKLVTPETRASDFVQPGHVFPVGAAAGGVLSHDGFAEAAVDLARLAGRRPGAVICDLMTENGQPAETSELKRFAFTHRLALIGLDELMAYRWDTEPIVERVSRRVIATKFGQLMAIGYRRKLSNREILVLMREHDQATMPATIHLHYQCIQGEIFGSSLCGCAGQLEKAVAATATEPGQCLIYVSRYRKTPTPGMKPRNCSHTRIEFEEERTRRLPKEVRDVLHDLKPAHS